jgi:hypothetical protein
MQFETYNNTFENIQGVDQYSFVGMLNVSVTGLIAT